MNPAPEREIRARIQSRGKIPFAEFMELALFHPRGGYYTHPTRVGASGDYFTSSSAHPVFGALLSIQLQQIWELMGAPAPFFVVEMGAGSGLLARDILDYVKTLPEPFRRSVRYLALERCASGPDPQIQRIVTDSIPLSNIVGCFLSNELIDSFPAHRFEIKDGRLMEVYVILKDDAFAEVLDEPSTPLLEERINSLEFALPEGFRGELNLALGPWMAEVAQALKRGVIVTIDYGYPAQELYSPKRARGTLQCYYQHTQSANPYLRIGEQDITSHVDFTSLAKEGRKHGIEPVALVTQREFLTSLGMGAFLKALRLRGLPQRDYYANRMAMQEFIKSEGLGNFKVLVQSRGLDNQGAKDLNLYGLTPENELARRMEANASQVEVPLLRTEHTPLLEGRYPHTTWEWPDFPTGPDPQRRR